MLNTIKAAALGVIEQSGPVAVMFAEVTKTTPKLEMTIDQRLVIDDDFLVITKQWENTTWEVGKKYLLLRVQGGQQFVVWDEVTG